MEIRALRATRVRGLAARIGTLVFIASLVTYLGVAWLSVHAVEDFLRGRIDRKFADLLQSSQTHLKIWYRQRELDLEVFARSPILAEGFSSQTPSAQAEASRYLAYVLENSPQYAGLAVLGSNGKLWMHAGEQVRLPVTLRKEITGSTATRVRGLIGLPNPKRQLVSTAIPGAPGVSLLGLLRLSSLGTALEEIKSGDATLALQGNNGTPIAGTLRFGSEDLQRAVDVEGTCLLGSGDDRSVVAATTVAPFGWTLVAEEPYAVAFAPVSTVVRRAFGLSLILVLLSSIAAFALGARRVAPVVALAQGARRLAAGEAGVRVDTAHARDEILSLAHSFNEMAERLDHNRHELENRNQELVRTNEVLEQLSITDGLTHIHNHRHFQDQLLQEARRAERTGTSLALVLLDIDDFKKLNDRMGHSAGDRVLEAVAEIMNCEIRETDYLARYGGEEFAMLLPNTDREGALALAEKVRLAISQSEIPVVSPDGRARITVSVGVAMLGKSTSLTFEAADRALYEAKASGKDCVHAASCTG